MKTLIQSLKGTRDFYPEEMALRTYLYETVRKVSQRFGYQEYEGPMLESLALYAAKSGDELVNQQSYVFPDRGGDMITLRPELTPTLARMVAQRQKQLVYPLRWWSWGPFWRYERPQKGRTREFFQWNVDLIGPDSPEADAELVAIGAEFLRTAGLKPNQVRILVNNRELMDAEMAGLGIPKEQRGDVFRLVDRRDKMTDAEWRAYAQDIGLQEEQLNGLVALLGNQDLWQKSPQMQRFFKAVQALGVGEYVQFAPHIIRGLLYYTGTVFEAWDEDGEFRAILGGGRYSNLVADVGGEPLSGVGFAMGDMVISLALKKFGCLQQVGEEPPAEVLVTVFDEAGLAGSFALAARLRQAGIRTLAYPEAAKIGKQIKFGDRMGLRLALVYGPDEQAAGLVAVKDLRSGQQTLVPVRDLAEKVKKMLAAAQSS